MVQYPVTSPEPKNRCLTSRPAHPQPSTLTPPPFLEMSSTVDTSRALAQSTHYRALEKTKGLAELSLPTQTLTLLQHPML